MKLIFALLIVSLPHSHVKSNMQLFKDFHTIYAKADFIAMEKLLSSDFVALKDDGGVAFPRMEYIDYMKGWNQVFKTKWNVESVKITGNTIKSVEYDTDIFNDYFYGNVKHKIEYTYTFENGKIKSIQIKTAKESLKSEKIFQERYNKFLTWIYKNHPTEVKYFGLYDKESSLEVKNLLELYLRIEKV